MMNQTLTEKKVLKKLGIPDFRHMTKDKVIEFATMLPQMDPEVAKKALEQFPNYANNVKELVGVYKEEIDNLVSSNNNSVDNVYSSYKLILETLVKELQQPELTFEEKERINERLVQVADKIREVDSDNKRFILKTVGVVTTALGIACGVLYAALGGNLNINNQNYLDNNADNSDNHLLS